LCQFPRHNGAAKTCSDDQYSQFRRTLLSTT
jgi:hypothetical protein